MTAMGGPLTPIFPLLLATFAAPLIPVHPVTLSPSDTRILVGSEDMMAWRSTLMYAIPTLLLVAGGVLVARRRRQ